MKISLSNKKLINLLVFFFSVPHGLISIWFGYHLSFISRQVEILRDPTGFPVATIQQQNMFLWVALSIVFFIWGFIIFKLLGECICRVLNTMIHTMKFNACPIA